MFSSDTYVFGLALVGLAQVRWRRRVGLARWGGAVGVGRWVGGRGGAHHTRSPCAVRSGLTTRTPETSGLTNHTTVYTQDC